MFRNESILQQLLTALKDFSALPGYLFYVFYYNTCWATRRGGKGSRNFKSTSPRNIVGTMIGEGIVSGASAIFRRVHTCGIHDAYIATILNILELLISHSNKTQHHASPCRQLLPSFTKPPQKHRQPSPPRNTPASPPAQDHDRRGPDFPQFVAVVRRHCGLQDLPRPELKGRALCHAKHAVPEHRPGSGDGSLFICS